MKILIILAITLFAFSAFAQDKFPDTPAGKRAAAVLQMANSTDDEALKKFILENMTPNDEITIEQRVERFRNVRNDLKGAKLIKLLQVPDPGIAFLVETAGGETFRIGLIIEPNLESRIAGIGLEPVGRDYAERPPGATRKVPESALIPETEKYLSQLAKDDKFSGTVLIAKDGKPVFAKAYGMADKARKTPNRADTIYNLGSINKLFTMLAIGILADEGKLSLDDKLGKFLPDYPNKDAREKITVTHLLTMSSGVGDFFGPEFEAAPKEKLRTNADFIPLFASKPLLFEPGKGNRYSNGGFILLGAIIEKASGKSYYDFVRERIFKPIGMTKTDSYLSDAKVANLAMGYTHELDPNKWMPNTSTRPARGSSAGGGYSTAQDLLKFANALGKTFKAPASLRAVRDPAIGALVQGGLGFAGGAPGINAMIDSGLPSGYTVIVLSNYDPPSAQEVSRYIRGLLGAE